MTLYKRLGSWRLYLRAVGYRGFVGLGVLVEVVTLEPGHVSATLDARLGPFAVEASVRYRRQQP